MGHFPYQCFKNPKRKQTLRAVGKYTKQWFVTRDAWIKKNPPNHQGYWICYLQIHPNCPKWLTLDMLTLDHVVARSRDGTKRFKQDNLKPACHWCNEMKGSRKLDEVK
jgi:5-methylcytosine-specific restriction endonuclease McrA